MWWTDLPFIWFCVDTAFMPLKESALEKITEFILLQKIIISVQPLQARYVFVWVAKTTHSHGGLGSMACYFFKKKAFEWRGEEEGFCHSVDQTDTVPQKSQTHKPTSRSYFSKSVQKHNWQRAPWEIKTTKSERYVGETCPFWNA